MDSTEAGAGGGRGVAAAVLPGGLAGVLLACLPLLVAAAAPEPAPKPTKPADPAWEGAVGLLFQYGPSYQGSEDQRLRLRPGLFLRHGRFSITTTGGFVTRRNDEVQRGLSAELLTRENLRLSLSARLDGGRSEGRDPMLDGMGDVRATVRARLSVVKDYGGNWKLAAGLSPDVLGRGGGVLADMSLNHEWRLTPTVRASAGLSLTAADRRYMQSYFGVTAEQSGRSGHPVYAASAGLRDLGVGFGLRTDFGPHWLGFANASATRLMGPTLDSPLTRRRGTWGLGGGLAWRF